MVNSRAANSRHHTGGLSDHANFDPQTSKTLKKFKDSTDETERTRLGWEGLFGQLDGEKHQGGSLRRVVCKMGFERVWV